MTFHNNSLEGKINYTHLDLLLASLYFPILVEYVKEYRSASVTDRKYWNVTYKDLVEKAQLIYGDIDEIQNANTISAGRRLGVIRQICNGNCPDMSCLIVNKNSKKPGDAYQAVFNPITEREELLKEQNGKQFDFDLFKEEFNKRVEALQSLLPAVPLKRKRITRSTQTKIKISDEMAYRIMYRYFDQHRAILPKSITTQRELIIKEIKEEVSVETAFDNAVKRIESEFMKYNKRYDKNE